MRRGHVIEGTPPNRRSRARHKYSKQNLPEVWVALSELLRNGILHVAIELSRCHCFMSSWTLNSLLLFLQYRGVIYENTHHHQRSPYGTERVYNALRLAHALLKQESEVTIFLMADAVSAAKANQKTPDGYYNVERMLKRVAVSAKVLVCGTCMDARGINETELVEGASRSTMEALASMTIATDKVLVF